MSFLAKGYKLGCSRSCSRTELRQELQPRLNCNKSYSMSCPHGGESEELRIITDKYTCVFASSPVHCSKAPSEAPKALQAS
eukprot:6761709-Alexandrium_andersonii.AAC.1